MIKKVFYLIIFLALAGCGYLKESQVIDNEQKFYFKGQANLYQSNKSKKLIRIR